MHRARSTCRCFRTLLKIVCIELSPTSLRTGLTIRLFRLLWRNLHWKIVNHRSPISGQTTGLFNGGQSLRAWLSPSSYRRGKNCRGECQGNPELWQEFSGLGSSTATGLTRCRSQGSRCRKLTPWWRRCGRRAMRSAGRVIFKRSSRDVDFIYSAKQPHLCVSVSENVPDAQDSLERQRMRRRAAEAELWRMKGAALARPFRFGRFLFQRIGESIRSPRTDRRRRRQIT